MGRFFSLFVMLLIIFGFLVHFDVELPHFFSWLGHLPGDLILRKENVTLYLPLTSSFLVSFILSFFLR